MTNNSPEKLSLVTCVYRSRPFLDDFLKKFVAAIQEAGFADYELIFVIDGSPDDSLDYLRERQSDYPAIKVIELARNFGHHYAALAGLAHASGSKVFLIDCDLEVRPGVLVDFHEKMREADYDVVYGYQESRKGGAVEKYAGGLFWRLFNLLSPTKVPDNMLTERLMARKFVDSVLTLGDKNVFLGGMMYWVGFKQIGIPLAKELRSTATTYTIIKRIHLLVEAVSSFSAVPLRLLFYFGMCVSTASIFSIIYFVIRKMLYPDSILIGFTFISSLIMLNLGLIIFALGIIGIYLSRIFRQTQNRPLFIVRNLF